MGLLTVDLIVKDMLDETERWLLRKRLLTTGIIRKEFERTNNRSGAHLDARDFPISDLKLSLDDFSRKQGWMK
jgi:hypothetical protein